MKGWIRSKHFHWYVVIISCDVTSHLDYTVCAISRNIGVATVKLSTTEIHDAILFISKLNNLCIQLFIERKRRFLPATPATSARCPQHQQQPFTIGSTIRYGRDTTYECCTNTKNREDNNNNILVNYTYLGVQTESLNAAASVALPPERRGGRDVSKNW